MQSVSFKYYVSHFLYLQNWCWALDKWTNIEVGLIYFIVVVNILNGKNDTEVIQF